MISRRAPDAMMTIQLGDWVRWRPGPLSRRTHEGSVEGFACGKMLVLCRDGVTRPCMPNAAERVA